MAGSIPASPTAEARRPARSTSPGAEAWRRFKRHKMAVASLALLLAMVALVVLGPLLPDEPWVPAAVNRGLGDATSDAEYGAVA